MTKKAEKLTAQQKREITRRNIRNGKDDPNSIFFGMQMEDEE